MLASLVRARFQDCSISSANDRDNELPLHEVASHGDLQRLQRLLATQEGHDSINLKDAMGCTPLRLAATEGHADCVENLIQSGADVNLADVKAQTPLFAAVKNGHEACVRLLLQHGASPLGSEPGHFVNPLYTATMNGYTDLVQLLLEQSSEVLHSSSQRGFIPHILGTTVAYNQFECLRLLLTAGADPNMEGGEFPMPSLYRLVLHHRSRPEYIHLLYEFGANLFTRSYDRRYPVITSPDSQQRSLMQLMQHLKETPRSLKSACRLTIRKTLGYKRLKDVNLLPLPTLLCAYLAHES